MGQNGTGASASRLAALRAELRRAGLDGFIVPRADEHLGEYVPACAERLAWLTGFTGSAGLAAVLPERAAVFTDGRYILQVERETDPAIWERHHILEEPPAAWLVANALTGAQIGYDPMLISEEALAQYSEAGLAMVAIAANPIDAIWSERPPSPMAPAVPHELVFAGRSSAEKREEAARGLREVKQDAAVITDPASVAWLFNIRGSDVPFTPFALGFAIIHADARAELFMAGAKLPAATRAWLGNDVAIRDRSELAARLAELSGKRVRVDRGRSAVWFATTLRQAGAKVTAGPDPCLLPKACKNVTEQQGARAAHRRDAVAVCRFLHSMAAAGPAGRETELSAAARLRGLREQVEGFRGESFPAISAAGEHGAIIHYRVSEATDRPIRADELYLTDSGAQYPDGTTDITRTIWTGPSDPPAELRDRYTRVLKGHIAIASLVFPEVVAGPHVDAFARRALWSVGLDYDHGTGHGVGSYLAVHEGPAGLSRNAAAIPLASGMILSNEPGFYLPNAYGMRIENLILVQPAELAGRGKPFLRFEVLTLAPLERRLIDPALLLPEEIGWVDGYHARVLAEIGPLLEPQEAAWLARACAQL